MRGPYQILLPLLGLFLVRVDLTDLFPIYLTVKVVEIYDGDTVLVSRGKLRYKVRLSKIDAPEKGQFFFDGSKNAGLFSKSCLVENLKKKSYELKFEKRDIYGRVLGDIDELSLTLIEKGCASLYPFAEFSSRSEKTKYLLALLGARRGKLGLWKYGGYRQPKLWRSSSKRTARRPSHR